MLGDNFDGGLIGNFDAAQRGRVVTTFSSLSIFKPDFHPVDAQRIDSFEWSDFAGGVGVEDFANERQKAGECVLRREAAYLQTHAQVFVKRDHHDFVCLPAFASKFRFS